MTPKSKDLGLHPKWGAYKKRIPKCFTVKKDLKKLKFSVITFYFMLHVLLGRILKKEAFS